ncbi:glycerophosphodiester phosphodiesterase family protein [Algicella marina]|uniref:glycerophosphodiester phosphodiesterase family protein n=1 Tax=Algicella marina TaxID=2683284 RepID=UPI00137ABC84|nr:glycerophosphodiester phosphodiesterase family protein [Algicella marina]
MLDLAFLRCPLAHRGLHDRTIGVVENSRAACIAAVSAGFGIEVDVQQSADGQAMVFHDDLLDRLTTRKGQVKTFPAAELGETPLTGSEETIPTLAEILEIVAGRVPLLIEIKDQSGRMGPTDGELERAVASELENYIGPIAVMSFNPHAVELFREAQPSVANGLTTDNYDQSEWNLLPTDARRSLSRMEAVDRLKLDFISHNHLFLSDAAVRRQRENDLPVLCWTVRSALEETAARAVADNITFEGYLPKH